MSATQKIASRAKQAIRDLVAENPWLRRNRLYYEVQRYRQYRPCKVDRSLAKDPSIVDILLRDGAYVIPNFLSKELCAQMLQELDGPMKEMLAGSYSGLYQIHPFLEVYRLGLVDKISPTAKREFFENEFIRSIARAYVGPTAESYRQEADFKLSDVHAGSFLQSELPHFDDWRHRFKAFLYLTDVGPENAPFVFYTGTHRYEDWNREYYIDYEMNGPSGRYGHFFPQEMRKIMKERDVREVEYTGAAGTLIFADTRGIHRGTTLRSGRRVLLNSTFGITEAGL